MKEGKTEGERENARKSQRGQEEGRESVRENKTQGTAGRKGQQERCRRPGNRTKKRATQGTKREGNQRAALPPSRMPAFLSTSGHLYHNGN